MHHEVYDGFAKALWAQGYAQAIEELVEDGKLRRTPGDAIDPHVPSVPAGLAERVEWLFERSLGEGAREQIEAAYEAARDDRYDAPADAEEFGWQLGMAWVGHGTALAKGGREIRKKLGYGEFTVDVRVDRTGAPSKAEIGYTNLPKVVKNRRRGSKRRGSKRRGSR